MIRRFFYRQSEVGLKLNRKVHEKNFFIITAVVCGMSCTTTAYAQFKIGGKKINVNKVVQAGTDAVKGHFIVRC